MKPNVHLLVSLSKEARHVVRMLLSRCNAPAQEPAVLPYLQEKQRYTYDIQLEARLQPAGSEQATTVTQTNFNLP